MNPNEITELKNFIQSQYDVIADSEDSFLQIGDIEIETDLLEVARSVNFFAEKYGLGGCKSISEFWDMIDKEDPVRLTALKIVHAQQQLRVAEAEYEIKRKNGRGTARGSSNRRPSNIHSDYVSTKSGMEAFLLNMGADKNQVEKASNEADKSSTNVDLTDITTENLYREDFDIADALKRLRALKNPKSNVKVNLKTYLDKQKELKKSLTNAK